MKICMLRLSVDANCSARIFVGDDAHKAEAAGKISSLVLQRPFPEPDALHPTYSTWRSFFEAAAAATAEISGDNKLLCNPAIQIESKWVTAEIIESILPWTITSASLMPGLPWDSLSWARPFTIARLSELPLPLAEPQWAVNAILLKTPNDNNPDPNAHNEYNGRALCHM
eukprot:SAG31_NODE_429_length_15801_cov_6.878551_7_plen_170_part_00